MPIPLSLTSSSTPPADTSCPETRTGVSAGENMVAFSMISASRWTTSAAAWPETTIPGCRSSSTRLYCSISEVAARTTSVSGTGSVHLRTGSSPASTRRFSELRRIRVTRWSIENRSDSRSGSSSASSRSSII